VDAQRNITECNQYIEDIMGIERTQIIGLPITKCLTPASNIFLDSYVFPTLLIDSEIQECQLTWLSDHGEKVPVVVNIKRQSDNQYYWSLFKSVSRDQLYNELLDVKTQLENKAKALHQLATTDPLTGLLNRREFTNLVKRMVSQSNRNQSKFSVLTIDIDDFKRVNDTYGHQKGDEIIIHVANLLLEARREHDLVARTGGEEFVIVLTETSEASAFNCAEKIRQEIESTPSGNLGVTVSIGVATSKPNTNNDFEKLLALSDKALYASKNNGKNQTTLTSQ